MSDKITNPTITHNEIEDAAWDVAQATLMQMQGETYMPDSEDCADLYDGFIAGAEWALKRINNKIEKTSNLTNSNKRNVFDKRCITLNW